MNDRLKKSIELPLHQYLGLKSISSDAGHGGIVLTVNEKLVNSSGILHGGPLYALCDICAYGGLLSLIDDHTEAVTHDIHVSILRPAKLGDIVRFNSEVVKLGKRICFIEVKVTVKDKSIALAKVTKSVLSKQPGR